MCRKIVSNRADNSWQPNNAPIQMMTQRNDIRKTPAFHVGAVKNITNQGQCLHSQKAVSRGAPNA